MASMRRTGVWLMKTALTTMAAEGRYVATVTTRRGSAVAEREHYCDLRQNRTLDQCRYHLWKASPSTTCARVVLIASDDGDSGATLTSSRRRVRRPRLQSILRRVQDVGDGHVRACRVGKEGIFSRALLTLGLAREDRRSPPGLTCTKRRRRRGVIVRRRQTDGVVAVPWCELAEQVDDGAEATHSGCARATPSPAELMERTRRSGGEVRMK